MGLRTPDLFQLASQRGLDMLDVAAMVELDEWRYNTTRYGKPAEGPSNVCCVWVCSVWKAGGLLPEPVQCTEQTNYDDYSLTIIDPSPDVPEQCKTVDDNPLCQLGGRYRLILNGMSARAPYPGMGQTCPSQGPNYTRPAGC